MVAVVPPEKQPATCVAPQHARILMSSGCVSECGEEDCVGEEHDSEPLVVEGGGAVVGREEAGCGGMVGADAHAWAPLKIVQNKLDGFCRHLVVIYGTTYV